MSKPKLTGWYPMSTPPKRKGYYKCTSCDGFHNWDGKYWNIDEVKYLPESWFIARTSWRGLTEPSK